MEITIKNIKVLIDSEDYQRISEHSWYLEKSNVNSYFRSRINKKLIRLHRFLLNPKKGEHVDHINGNTFDNRKENLRICSPKENSRNAKMHKNNRSGYKGVFLSKGIKNPWHCCIYLDGKNKWLGSFSSKELAAEAYNKAALELYGQFAKLNDIV